MILLDLFMLTVIVCFIVDLSGIQYSVKKAIWKWVFNNNKPFQDFEMKFPFCSLCMTHHTLAIYLLCIGEFGIFNYLIVCILSFLSSNVTSWLLIAKDAIICFENKVSNLINKF